MEMTENVEISDEIFWKCMFRNMAWFHYWIYWEKGTGIVLRIFADQDFNITKRN